MCARRLKYPFIMDYMRPSELSVDEFHSFCKPQHLFNPHACGLCLRLWLSADANRVRDGRPGALQQMEGVPPF